jgi:hypothetical protein
MLRSALKVNRRFEHIATTLNAEEQAMENLLPASPWVLAWLVLRP